MHAGLVFLLSFVPLSQGIQPKRFPMKTHTIIKSAVAAFALAFAPNLPAQTAASGASGPKAEGKAAEPAPAPTPKTQAADLGSMNVSICYEAFSLPIAKAGELQRKGLTDEELYKELLSAVKLERMLVLRTKSGQRAVLDTASEYKYPNVFMQPEPPGMLGIVPGGEKTPTPTVPLPLAPTSFENKDVGDTMEFEPTLSSDAKAVDVQILVSHTALARREKWGQGLAEVELPQFESQKLMTNITASVGSPRFIGTLNPPFGNGVAARAEQNVWFCFITPSIAQNNIAAPKKITR